MPRWLNVSIIGTTGPDPRYWPGMVFSSDLAQEVVLALASGPRPVSGLAAELGRPAAELEPILNGLRDLRAVRVEGGRLWLDFSFLTTRDQAALDAVVPSLGQELARCVRERARTIDAALAALPGGSSPRRRAEYAFAVVGCMGLDWNGISTLQRRGYLSPAREYPDGGRYVLVGEERRDVRVLKDYCGSRTGGGERYAFTSFGDHSGPRHCLPDLFFRAERALGAVEWPVGLGATVGGVLQRGTKFLYDELGAVVAGRREPGGPLGEFLAQTGYVRDGEALVPLFTSAVLDPVREVASAVGDAVADWAARTVPELGRTLAALTPLRHGVDRGHFLNHIWHFIFAQANRVLAEEGFLLDPEPKPDGQGRYLAWVAETDFYQALWASDRDCLP